MKCDELKENLQRINDQIAEKVGRKHQLEAFIAKLKQVEGLTDFDEHVFAGTVEQVIVNRAEKKNEKRLTFCFKDGTEITV